MRLVIQTLLAVSALSTAAAQWTNTNAQDVIEKLNLVPNVEKGYYVETFEDSGKVGNRSYSTAIYYLLEGNAGASYWHKVDAVEIWHHYIGAPLTLELSWNNGTATQEKILGDNIFDNQSPQVVIPGGQWQRARSLGDWTLVGTTVAPGFTEIGFELAEPDWMPNDGTN